ncbi:MAG: mycofactocin system transcriptional regulator [Solirubrobacterales bacterium]|nr:mycofactocin system transcriptional regulator [Solirubrobacterales bacterium]
MSSDHLPREPLALGRPRGTTHAEVERVALRLFARNGFEETTMADIAEALGVGRRSLFRYFPSKNDIVWGDFDYVLDRLEGLLEATPPDVEIMRGLTDAIVESNRYGLDQLPELRIRMMLITSVPALQAHSMLRYEAWCQVVAKFVARRRGEEPTDLIPQTIGRAMLGTSMAAFVHWVGNPDEDLGTNLEAAFGVFGDSTDLNRLGPAS